VETDTPVVITAMRAFVTLKIVRASEAFVAIVLIAGVLLLFVRTLGKRTKRQRT